MIQYCRYCSNLVANNGIWCEELEKEVTYSTAHSPNHCKHFQFCPVDAFMENEKEYKPREKYEDYEYCGTLFDLEAN